MGPQSADSSTNEKRTSRDLGAAPPDQKPARLALKVVREPVQGKGEGTQRPQRVLSRGGEPKGPSSLGRGDPRTPAHKGRGPKDPGVAAPLAAAGCRGNCWRVVDGRSGEDRPACLGPQSSLSYERPFVGSGHFLTLRRPVR